ncbi:hypothetical protein GCM10010222_20070 [Streptomyces tanashiensis]|nr:hypothetical protein GCM10010222_20070 [Streptomyces tanashiensis]
MVRRLPMPLRAWSGALLVCALLFCLGGLARPAMAMAPMAPMSPAMPGMAMEAMGAPASTSAPAPTPALASAAGDPAAATAAEPGAAGTRCPMVDPQCVSPQGTLTQDVQPLADPIGPSSTSPCAHVPDTAWPHAPPEPLPPPDPHRLCVSRT